MMPQKIYINYWEERNFFSMMDININDITFYSNCLEFKIPKTTIHDKNSNKTYKVDSVAINIKDKFCEVLFYKYQNIYVKIFYEFLYTIKVFKTTGYFKVNEIPAEELKNVFVHLGWIVPFQ